MTEVAIQPEIDPTVKGLTSDMRVLSLGLSTFRVIRMFYNKVIRKDKIIISIVLTLYITFYCMQVQFVSYRITQMKLQILIQMNLGNTSSTFQPYDSVGALSMVDIRQITAEENLDYLENLCSFIDQMNLNPLWFEQQTPLNKLKLLQIYQLAINYSKNLSHNYHQQIEELNSRTSQLKEQNEQKEKAIRQHKGKVEKLKDAFRTKKHKYYKIIYKNLKSKLRQEQQKQHHQLRNRNDSYQHQGQHSVPNWPMTPPYYVPRPDMAHQMPPDYQHHPYHYPYPYHYGQPVSPKHPQQAAQQAPGNPLFGDPQIAAKLNNRLFAQNAISNDPQKHPEKNPNILIADPHLIHTKKTDKSVLVQKEEEDPSDQQNSQIIARHNATSNKFEPLVKPINKMSRKISVEEQDELPDLMANSKKKVDLKSAIQEPTSKNSISSREEQHIDSIANIRLGAGSKVHGGPQNLQSRLSKRPDAPKPIKVSAIDEQEDDMAFSLPGKSSVRSKSKKTEKDKKQELNLDDIVPEMLGGSKFDQRGSKRPQNQGSILDGRPQRSSQMDAVNKKYQEQRVDSAISKSIEPNLDEIMPQMFGGSKFEKKGVKFQTESMLEGRPQRASQMPSDELRASSKVQLGDFSLNLDSKITKKQKDLGQSQSSNALHMYNQKPMRKSKLNNSMERASEGWLGIPKKASVEEQQVDILNSNVGHTPFKAQQEDKMFPERPQRSSQMDFLTATNVKNSPRRSQTIEEKNQEDYEDDFDVVDEESLMKTRKKDDNLDFDTNLLEKSYAPSSKKTNKDKQEVINNTNNLEITTSNKKGVEKSSVNIVFPSSQSISENYKYQKLKNQEFKIKQNITGTLKTETYMSESADPFDFISCMPANSVIAKRPLLKSQIHKPNVSQPNNPSAKNVDTQKSIGVSNHININLINPDNVKEEIKTKQDYKKTDKVIEVDNSDENKPKNNEEQDEKDLGQSSLPSIKQMNALQSIRPIRTNSKNHIARQNSRADSQLQLKLEDESYLAKNEDPRKSILYMIKQFEIVDRKKIDPSKLDDQTVDDVLKRVCKVGFDDLKNIDEIQKYIKRMEKETNKACFQKDRLKKVVEQVLRQEQISTAIPPRLEQHSPFKDSLMYSNSSFKNPNDGKQKKIEAKDSNLCVDMVQSLNFDPNLPKVRRKSSIENDITKNKSSEERKNSNESRKDSKSANKYVLDSKREGKHEQQKLFKNVEEGIAKYDKDDDLNKEVLDMMNKNKGKNEEQYEDDFQWD